MDKIDFIIKIPMTLPWLIWAIDFTILIDLKATRLRVF